MHIMHGIHFTVLSPATDVLTVIFVKYNIPKGLKDIMKDSEIAIKGRL